MSTLTTTLGTGDETTLTNGSSKKGASLLRTIRKQAIMASSSSAEGQSIPAQEGSGPTFKLEDHQASGLRDVGGAGAGWDQQKHSAQSDRASSEFQPSSGSSCSSPGNQQSIVISDTWSLARQAQVSTAAAWEEDLGIGVSERSSSEGPDTLAETEGCPVKDGSLLTDSQQSCTASCGSSSSSGCSPGSGNSGHLSGSSNCGHLPGSPSTSHVLLSRQFNNPSWSLFQECFGDSDSEDE